MAKYPFKSMPTKEDRIVVTNKKLRRVCMFRNMQTNKHHSENHFVWQPAGPARKMGHRSSESPWRLVLVISHQRCAFPGQLRPADPCDPSSRPDRGRLVFIPHQKAGNGIGTGRFVARRTA